MVELCDLLLGPIFWQLDAWIDHGWYRSELVAVYSNDILKPNNQLDSNVLQFAVR